MPFKIYQEITEHLSYVKDFCAKNGELISVKTKASWQLSVSCVQRQQPKESDFGTLIKNG